MRAYVAVFGARFRALLQYRAAALAGLGTQVFWGLIRVMIFGAFYATAAEAAPIVRRCSIAFSMSPSISTRAFLQSIIPAPVRSRSAFTWPALMLMALSFL